ncbi:MAG: arginyltransferase [Alphaproteobacteria bacterium]|nr:arginyltransferase [Alphaproteobacteria bacterium]
MSNQRSNRLFTGMVQFNHSPAMPCPYLPDRIERQLYVELGRPAPRELFQRLSRAGFRRSHHIAYRPACPGCNACVPVRVDVQSFQWTQSWRRVWRRNADLKAENAGLTVTDEQYRLFRRYVRSRHGDGDMAMMDQRDYSTMILASPVDTRIIEFRDDAGELIAACLTDFMPDGLSAVYSFFDPDQDRRSLGSFMVLWLIGEARRRGLPHVYLGFWVENSRKMAYKMRFRPLQAFGPDGWTPLP